MRQSMEKVIAVLWGLLGVGILVNIVGGGFWRWLTIGGTAVFAVGTVIAILHWRQLRLQAQGEQRQQRLRTLRNVVIFAVVGLVVAVLPQEFWTEIGSGLAVLGAVGLIMAYMVRSMFPAPQRKR